MQYTKCCVLFSMHEKNVRLQKHPHDFLRNAVIVGYCCAFVTEIIQKLRKMRILQKNKQWILNEQNMFSDMEYIKQNKFEDFNAKLQSAFV